MTDQPSRTRYAVELTQPDGSMRLARLDGCAIEAGVRALFGLGGAPIVPIDAGDPRLVDPSTQAIACPDAIASDARAYAEPRADGASYLEYRTVAADGAVHPTFVIPNQCVGLMTQFHIADRARAQASKVTAPPGSESPRTYLSCIPGRSRDPYTGWQVHTAFAFSLNDERAFVLLQHGDTSFLVDAIDGEPFYDADPSAADALINRIRQLFEVPANVQSRTDVVLEADAPELGRPLLDICLDRCDDPSWIPSHKIVSGAEVACISGTLDPVTEKCNGSVRAVVHETLRLDGSTRRLVTLGPASLALGPCRSDRTWERYLGFDADQETARWIRVLESRYNEGTSDAQNVISLPGLVDVPTCRVKLHDGFDLSSTTLADLIQSCPRTDSIVEVSLGKHASLSGRPFAIDASVLPPSITTVRVNGAAGDGTTVLVSQASCGFGANAACLEPKPAISVAGDLRVEIQDLKLLPKPSVPVGPITSDDAGPPPMPAPLARVAVDASCGANANLSLVLRSVNIGDRALAPFYKGVRFNGGSLVVYNSNVRAFSDAITASDASVEVVSWPQAQAYEVASLAAVNPTSAMLRDLRGQSLAGSIGNFRALVLDQNVQAFLANINVSGPSNVAWTSDRNNRCADGEEGILSINSSFSNGTSFFLRDSLMLTVEGRGYLRFRLPTINGFGNVLSCPSHLFETSPDVVPRIVFDVPSFTAIARDLNIGICSVDTPWTWTPTSNDDGS